MDAKIRREILKELPEKAVVIYHGPSVYLQKCTLYKLYDRSSYMRVTDGRKEYRVKYFNLSCTKIQVAIHVSDKLNGVLDPDPDALPF